MLLKPRSAFDSIQSKRSFVRCIRCEHEFDDFQQASIIDQAKSIFGYRSRFLPRVSTRALTLTQLDTLALGVLGGVGGLRTLYGLNHTSAKKTRVPGALSSKQEKIIDGADNSTRTQQTTSFPSGCSLPTRIQDDWCRMIEASSLPRAWLGKGRIGSLGAAG